MGRVDEGDEHGDRGCRRQQERVGQGIAALEAEVVPNDQVLQAGMRAPGVAGPSTRLRTGGGLYVGRTLRCHV